MHNTIAVFTRHAELLLPILASFVAVLLTHWLTTRSRDRRDEAVERATLQGQVDAFVTAAAALRGASGVSDTVWENPKEKRRATAIVILGAIGGWASAEVRGRTDAWRFAVGLRDAAQLIAREVQARKVALSALQGPTLQLMTAATPLMHHHDERLAQAVESLLAAAEDIDDLERFERELAAFGQASRAALRPPPSVWSRLVRRSR
ncbi:hypothetical protein ABZV87_28050 [Streptomyces tendae]|uniref:hypothetical protein n=1 Tax=Streptomyces tendae TaxID=1932 RepID=UPI0033A8A2CE